MRLGVLLVALCFTPPFLMAEDLGTSAERKQHAEGHGILQGSHSNEAEKGADKPRGRAYKIASQSPFFLPRDSTRPRSTFWLPLFSFVIPGLDQLIESQESYGLGYLGTALVASSYSAYVLDRYEDSHGESARDSFEANPNIYEKKVRLGEQLAMSAGSLSAYHAYRSAVSSYTDGRYDFLGEGETPAEILLAPFRFELLARTSTLAPLAIAAGLHLLAMSADFESEQWRDYEKVALGGDGLFYTGAYSYLAGTNEEALFRGWLLPEMYVAFGSKLWAKVANAALFGLAHLGNIQTPLPQLLFGYYLSDVTIDNNWKISESVFIHSWWNVFAFLTVHQIRKKETAQMILPPLLLPALNLRF